MFDLNSKLQGVDQLQASLKALPPELAHKALSKSLMAGAQVIADEMSAEAPREKDIGPRQKNDQHLADAIVIKQEKNPVGSAAEVYVGPAKSVVAKARWIEYGAAAHAIVTKLTKAMRKFGQARKGVLASADQVFGSHVSHPGVHPKPFMRPAFAKAGPEAVAAISEALKPEIQAAAKKVKK